VLRRYEQNDTIGSNETAPIKSGELEIDFETKQVRKGGKAVLLTAKEFKILDVLLKRPKKVFTREELLDLIWGYDYLGDSRSVDMTIMRLRKKLEDDSENPRYIRTVYGFGYQFGGDAD